MTAARVLIVDDNQVNIELVSFVLEAGGFVVESAADAFVALETIGRFAPDLILMDIQLPEVDGLTLTRRLKADPEFRHIRVVALTAYAMKGDEAKFRDAGCDGYIAKPVDVATLAATVRAHLADAGAG